MMYSILAISIGASLGAVLRWVLGLGLNTVFPTIPLGALAANLIGGYLIGVAFVFFANNPQLSPEWRLLIITGFLGGLTTFSTFSVEVTSLIQQNRVGWAGAAIMAHVLGSLLMTVAGMGTMAMLRK